jgi:hypothetical protein
VGTHFPVEQVGMEPMVQVTEVFRMETMDLQEMPVPDLVVEVEQQAQVEVEIPMEVKLRMEEMAELVWLAQMVQMELLLPEQFKQMDFINLRLAPTVLPEQVAVAAAALVQEE